LGDTAREQFKEAVAHFVGVFSDEFRAGYAETRQGKYRFRQNAIQVLRRAEVVYL
jgi:hypothetical protein